MSLALEGVTVIDMANMWAAPGAAMYLADQGAQVIKVEPLGGDQSRQLSTNQRLGQDSKAFQVFNRNKKGVRLDFFSPAGREVVYRLISRGDVFIHNFRPGVAEELGYGYETLRELNPGLIYASVSAFGTRGRYASRPGYDRIVQGLAGIMGIQRTPEGLPLPAPLWVADCSGPMLLAYGITLALLARERTGRGQKVETSLLDLALAMQAVELVQMLDNPIAGGGPGTTYNIYRCKDGPYINVITLNNKHWRRLCQCLGMEELAEDPRFSTQSARNVNGQALAAILDPIFADRPSDEWLRTLEEADVPCGPILTQEQVFQEPDYWENQMLAQVEHPRVGRVRMMGIPVRLSEMPGRIASPAPTLGQHTQEVLEWLGYGAQDIARLQGDGIL